MKTTMPGRASQPWCPSCHGPPGPDCPNTARTPRQVRRSLKHELQQETAQALHERQDE